ncbi:MAG TPA: hypothetical protein VMN57_08445 [Anaerolineales bacterium]|nr:hypothetical protein [Anaerolineales bacterium]
MLILLPVFIIFFAVQGTALALDREKTSAGLDFFIYLPIVQRNFPPGIHGVVTSNGSAAANVFLELRFYNGTSWSTSATTTTDSNGMFIFLNPPKLLANQLYYVLFPNSTDNTSQLAAWGTAVLDSYDGGPVHIGDFDIADIVLVAPVSGASVALPRQFTWQKRSATPTDSYEFNLTDFADGDPWFWTDPPLGYVDSYNLTSLPGDFESDFFYVWFMFVYDNQGGFGISYWARFVSFTNLQNPEAAPDKAPVPVNTLISFDQVDLPDVVQMKTD